MKSSKNCIHLDLACGRAKWRSLLYSVLAASGLIALSEASASAQDYYGINNGGGGAGTWQDGNATTLWYDFNTNTHNLQWDNTLQNVAFFGNGGSGTVNVVGNVSADYLEFNGSGNYLLNGSGTINKNANSQQYGLVLQNDTTNNVTIDNNMVIDTAGGTDRLNIVDYGANSTIDIEGQISFTDSVVDGPGYRSLIFNANNTGQTFILNGMNTTGTTKAISIRFNEGVDSNAKLILKGDYTTVGTGAGDWLEIPAGIVYLDTSLINTSKSINTYNGGQDGISDTHEILTEGAQTIGSGISAQNLDYTNNVDGFVTVGGSTADASSYTGGANMGGTGLHLTAVAGGRVNFNSINGGSEQGIVKTGAGTVVLYGSNTYNLNPYFGNVPVGAVAMDIQSGTVLITNTSGSAFGNNSGVVKVEAGATLGGSGISTQQVVAAAATSTIAPGDAGQANLNINPSIGILHLADGLVATSGLTLDFKINGSSYDTLDFGTGDVTLGGVTTVNFTDLGTVLTGPSHIYTFASDGGVWSDTGTFVLNAPAGYTIASYTFDTDFNQFDVEFAAVPEPSVWALMLGGFAFLGFCIRRKNRTV